VNAWNEWAEKAVMEPGQIFGSGYLDVLREALADARPQQHARPDTLAAVGRS